MEFGPRAEEALLGDGICNDFCGGGETAVDQKGAEVAILHVGEIDVVPLAKKGSIFVVTCSRVKVDREEANLGGGLELVPKGGRRASENSLPTSRGPAPGVPSFWSLVSCGLSDSCLFRGDLG
jgi:hypothetical protein